MASSIVRDDRKVLGRERELDVLASALRDVEDGRVRMLAIVGEAGIGKTSTVEEFVRRAALPADRVLWGRCSEQLGAPTFWPWVRVLREYAGTRDAARLREELAGDAEAIGRLVPALRDKLGGVDVAPADVDDPQARFHLFDGVTSFLQRHAAAAPLVVVLEDIHWADDASLLLLAFVAREVRGASLLIVVTYRERESRGTSRAFADLARLVQRVPLKGLDRPTLATMVARATTDAPSAGLVDRLFELTEGNPFFLEEILRGLGDDGASETAGRVALPDSLRATIRRRLDPLPDDTRTLLGLAAVVGREFDVGLLQRAAEEPAETVLARIDAATSLGVVEEHDAAGAFRFTHALIREMLYGELRPAARAELHRRVAMALEAAHPEATAPYAALAIHYFHAAPLGTGAQAFDYAMRAGRAAAALAAHDDAMIHFERALGALALQAPDEVRRLEALLAHGTAAWAAGHNPKARDSLRLAARSARALGDGAGLARAALMHSQASPPSGAPDPTSVALLEEALAVVGDRDPGLRTHLLALLGLSLYFSADLERCHAVTREAVETGRHAGNPLALATALLIRQTALLGPGAVDDRLALADEIHRLGVEHGIDGVVHGAQMSRILCALERGEIAAAAHDVEQVRLRGARTRLPEYQWHATVQRATLAMLEGRFDDASRLAAEALAVRRDANDPAVSHVYLVQTYLGRTETGDATALEDLIRNIALDFPAVSAWRCILALLLEETGRTEAARKMLDELAPNDFAALRRDFLYPAALAWLTRLVARQRDAARARTLYALLEPFADRNIVVSLYSPGCLGSAQPYLGLLAATFGDRDLAIRHLEPGVTANERMGARPFAARTQYWLARILGARNAPGDAERAAALVASARETAAACGMSVLLEEIAAAKSPLGHATAAAPAATTVASTGGTIAATLHHDVEFWTVRCGGDAFQLKDSKGLRFLQTLLQSPGREVHVLDLSAEPAEAGGPTARQAAAGDAGELLDRSARAAYQQRLEDLRDELEEAERFNDPARAHRARREIDFLGEELARAVGLGGRDRRAAAAAERARVNVTRTIAAVLKRIASASPTLGQHLAATISTGYFCSYTPDPRVPIIWSF